MRLLIVGDVHGQLTTLHRIVLRAWMLLGIDAIIQVGDFGFFPRVLVAYQRTWGRFPVPVHAIDGNHEDHPWLARCLAQGDAADWLERLNLHYHPRGTVSHLDGATIGWLGGALHADRPQEGYATTQELHAPPRPSNVIRPHDQAQALTAWRAEPPDLLVTHTAPSGLGIGLRGSPHLATQVAEVITAAGWETGPPDDIGDPALTTVISRLPPVPRRTLVFGHHHRWHHVAIDHAAAGHIDACCVGSADGSDGHLGLGRTAIYDTRARTLTIGERLPLLSASCRSRVEGLLAAMDGNSATMPLAILAQALGGKQSHLFRHVLRQHAAAIRLERPGGRRRVIDRVIAEVILEQIHASDLAPLAAVAGRPRSKTS